MLSAGGKITADNLKAKLAGGAGTRGLIAADFVQAPQAWWDKWAAQQKAAKRAKDIFSVLYPPNLNTKDFKPDGILPQLMINQNALLGATFRTRDNRSQFRDPITGLPRFMEGKQGEIQFYDYLASSVNLGLTARISRVDATRAGVFPSFDLSASGGVSPDKEDVLISNGSSYVLSRKGADLKPMMGSIYKDSGKFTFTVQADKIKQGYRFYELNFYEFNNLASGSITPIGKPFFFAIHD